VGEITLLTKHGKDLAAIAPMDIIQPKDVGKMKKKPQREE
jgi:hypothetical protein